MKKKRIRLSSHNIFITKKHLYNFEFIFIDTPTIILIMLIHFSTTTILFSTSSTLLTLVLNPSVSMTNGQVTTEQSQKDFSLLAKQDFFLSSVVASTSNTDLKNNNVMNLRSGKRRRLLDDYKCDRTMSSFGLDPNTCFCTEEGGFSSGIYGSECSDDNCETCLLHEKAMSSSNNETSVNNNSSSSSSSWFDKEICGKQTKRMLFELEYSWSTEGEFLAEQTCTEYTQGPYAGDVLCVTERILIEESYDQDEVRGCNVTWNDEACNSCVVQSSCGSSMMIDCSNLPGGDIWNFCDFDVSVDLLSPFAALDREFKNAAAKGCSSSSISGTTNGLNEEGEEEELSDDGLIVILGIILLALCCGGGTTYKLKKDWCGNYYLEEV